MDDVDDMDEVDRVDSVHFVHPVHFVHWCGSYAFTRRFGSAEMSQGSRSPTLARR